MTHREAAAALHADVGGELRNESWASEILIRAANDSEPQVPRCRAAVNDAGLWYVNVIDADHDLARDILRLVAAAREQT